MQRTGRARRLPLVLVLLLLLGSAAHARAGDWVTKGGGPEHRSTNTDPVGLMQVEEAWRENLGLSATQPVAVGQRIYHLAGKFLWEIQLDAYGKTVTKTTKLGDPGESGGKPVNVVGFDTMLISQSSPTYSAETQAVYFGTAYGRLWVYQTAHKRFRFINIELGCPIVGSPLVLRDLGKEFVIVADRPNFEGEKLQPGQPACPRTYGKVWVVEGLDTPDGALTKREYQAAHTKAAEGGFGGFITPSAVPGKAIPSKGPTLLIGADGFEGGRAIRLVLDRTQGYTLQRTYWVDGPHGFAGSFVSDGTNGYWLDTAGWLWGVNLEREQPPTRWSDYHMDIPNKMGLTAAFTNTEPAVVVLPDEGTYLYLTLRNIAYPGSPALRGGSTGSDGAVAAIGPDGQLLWARRLGETERGHKNNASINTAPLAIQASNVLLFGDVNGSLYSQALQSASPTGHPQPFLVPKNGQVPQDKLTLLEDGEEPAVGWSTFSQVSGVGVDPAMAGRLVLVGVNYEGKDGEKWGRLVAYRVKPAYNLAFLDRPPVEPLQLQEGQPATVANRVGFALFADTKDEPLPDTLGQLCEKPIKVEWYVTGPGGYQRKLDATVIPAALTHGASAPLESQVTLEQDDPDEGQIVGIIDPPTLAALAGAAPASPALQPALSIADTQPHLTCTHASEILQLPDSKAPLSGLADNLLAIPYKKGKVVDDPFVAALHAPAIVRSDRFTVRVHLGYWTNTGATEAKVRLRVWARNIADAEGPETWADVTIPATPAGGAQLPFWDYHFSGASAGIWEVIAEIAYPPDTNIKNNVRQAQVIVEVPEELDEPGTGSDLTG